MAPWPPTGSPAAPSESSAPSGLRRRIAVRELFYFCRRFCESESTAWPVASLCPGLTGGSPSQPVDLLWGVEGWRGVGCRRYCEGALSAELDSPPRSSYGIQNINWGRWGSLGWKSTSVVTSKIAGQSMGLLIDFSAPNSTLQRLLSHESEPRSQRERRWQMADWAACICLVARKPWVDL